MSYEKTTWVNETPAASPIRFTIRDSGDNILYDDVRIELKTSVTPGTAVNATNLNKIEQGIADAHALAESIELSQLIDGILTADAAGRAKMADGFITLAKLAASLRFEKLFEFVGDGLTLMDWTSIPQTFTHLLMIYNGISTRESAGEDALYFRVNNDSGAHYGQIVKSFSVLGGDSLTPENPQSLGLNVAGLPAQNLSYLMPGTGIALFPNYASTASINKACMSLQMNFGAYAAGMSLASSYRDSTEAITRLAGYIEGGYFPRAGSVFSLYGFN